MSLNEAMGLALARARLSQKLTQEDFSVVSSRTYVSSLERGLKSPTIEKVNSLAIRIGIHPATLVILTYLIHEPEISAENLVRRVVEELQSLVEPHSL